MIEDVAGRMMMMMAMLEFDEMLNDLKIVEVDADGFFFEWNRMGL